MVSSPAPPRRADSQRALARPHRAAKFPGTLTTRAGTPNFDAVKILTRNVSLLPRYGTVLP